MDLIPSSKKDLNHIAQEEIIKLSGTRQLIAVSKPFIQNAEIFLTLNVIDSGYSSFFYPLKNIDDYHVMAHLMFKLSSDEDRVITVSAIIVESAGWACFSKWNFCPNHYAHATTDLNETI